MRHVLRHYLPIRKALLVISETLILSVVIFAGLSSDLWAQEQNTLELVLRHGLSPQDALWRALLSSITVALLVQVSISFNELYDFSVSSSRFDRASRFVGSAGVGIALSLAAVVATNLWGL